MKSPVWLNFWNLPWKNLSYQRGSSVARQSLMYYINEKSTLWSHLLLYCLSCRPIAAGTVTVPVLPNFYHSKNTCGFSLCHLVCLIFFLVEIFLEVLFFFSSIVHPFVSSRIFSVVSCPGWTSCAFFQHWLCHPTASWDTWHGISSFSEHMEKNKTGKFQEACVQRVVPGWQR